MSTPDDLRAVAALHRCMATGDYAGASRLVTKRSTLNGLTALADPTWKTTAGEYTAYLEANAAWRAEHEASVQRQQKRDITTLVALVAEVFDAPAERRAA